MTVSSEQEPADQRVEAEDAVGRLTRERDAALEAVCREQRRTVALTGLAHAVAGAHQVTDLARVVAAALPEVLSCDACAVWLWDPELGEIRAADTAGLTPELHDALLALSVKASETPELADLLTRREPLVLNAGAVTPTLELLLQGLGLQAAIGVALLSGSRLLGVVTAGWRDRPLEGATLAEATTLLQGVADHAASALLNALLLQDARHQSLHDALTRLPNRLAFQLALDDALRLPGPGTVLIVCDLDRFKVVNDTYGHPAGDEVLRLVAGRLRAAVTPQALVSRLSGDEFAVLLPATGDQATALTAGQALVASLEEPLRVDGHPLSVTLSVGAAVHVGPGADPEAFLGAADAAMYAAKRAGRNQVALSERGTAAWTRLTPSLAGELRAGIDGEQLRLVLQPVLRLGAADGTQDGSRDVVGAEALVRWQHPRLGLLTPAGFIALAEEEGSIIALDLWVLRASCREAAGWQPLADGTPRHVAVNLSLSTLADEHLYEAVRTSLLDAALPPQRLHVEVLESRALRDRPEIFQKLTALRHLGVRVSLDDFGTGYSTLSWLLDLPVDRIKIDRSFTAHTDLDDDEPRRRTAKALLRGLAVVGQELDVEVLAEGVETEEQLAAVHDAGCRLVQGYLLGRPVPPDALRERLRQPAGRPPA